MRGDDHAGAQQSRDRVELVGRTVGTCPTSTSHAPAQTSYAVQVLEDYVHRYLIKYLPAVDKATVIQDPPAELLIEDSNGRRFGFDGRSFRQMKGVYLSSDANRAIVLPFAKDGAYQVTASGPAGERFALSAATVDFAANGPRHVIHAVTQEGAIPASGKALVPFEIDTKPVKVALRLKRRGRRVSARIRCSKPCSARLYTKFAGSRVRRVWRGNVERQTTTTLRYRRRLTVSLQAEDSRGYIRVARKRIR